MSIPVTADQDGIFPQYSLFLPSTSTGVSTDTITVSAVVYGQLSRQGLDMLMRRMYAKARNHNPKASGFKVYLYESEAAANAGAGRALASYTRQGSQRPKVFFDESYLTSSSIPATAPALFSEAQRESIYRMLPPDGVPPKVIQRTEASLLARYSLRPEDLLAIREEGQRKQWKSALKPYKPEVRQ